jgi:hypothetical protein
MRIILSAVLAAGAILAQELRIETFHGRQAFVLENRHIRVSALRGGGHLAEIRFRSGDAARTVNPMRVPHYQTIEPYQYDPRRHDALYGSDSHRWLSSGYMGHLLCFPVFGAPSSPAEVRSGLGNHGEAPIVEWKPVAEPEKSRDAIKFRYGADLPKTQFRVDRTLTLPADEAVIIVEEWVENLTDYDRPINWVQHATFGPPFIEPGQSFLDLSGGRGQVITGSSPGNSLQADSALNWPDGLGADGVTVSLRPFQPRPHSGTYFAVLMDSKRPLNYFTLYNPNFPVLIGYLFRASENPWLGDFQENQRFTGKPWDGKAVTRGVEFGTTPFPEGLRRSVERGSMFGVPTYRWIGAREKRKVTFAVFLAETPPHFNGVQDVSIDGPSITLHERGSARRITVPAGGLSMFR